EGNSKVTVKAPGAGWIHRSNTRSGGSSCRSEWQIIPDFLKPAAQRGLLRPEPGVAGGRAIGRSIRGKGLVAGGPPAPSRSPMVGADLFHFLRGEPRNDRRPRGRVQGVELVMEVLHRLLGLLVLLA